MMRQRWLGGAPGLAIASLLIAGAPVRAGATTVAVSVINQSGGAHSTNTFGWSFTTGNVPLSVTDLGFWDEGSDGLLGSHEVGIWDLTTEILLGSTTVSSGTTDPIDGAGWRYNSSSTPFVLAANTSYVIGALAISSSDEIGFLSPGTDADNITTAPEISAFLTGRTSTANTFTFPDVPITAGRYFGPNFRFEPVPEPSTAILFGGGLLGLAAFSRRRKA